MAAGLNHIGERAAGCRPYNGVLFVSLPHNANERLGSTFAWGNGDGFSRPTGTTHTTAATAFALSSGEANAYLGKYTFFTTLPKTTAAQGGTDSRYGWFDKGETTGSGKNWAQLSDRTSVISWLRSPGYITNGVSRLYWSTQGGVDAGGYLEPYSVRPAMWVQGDGWRTRNARPYDALRSNNNARKLRTQNARPYTKGGSTCPAQWP